MCGLQKRPQTDWFHDEVKWEVLPHFKHMYKLIRIINGWSNHRYMREVVCFRVQYVRKKLLFSLQYKQVSINFPPLTKLQTFRLPS